MQNKTTLVTGASDGIGLECCKILAAKGSNLILVSRRQPLLDEIAESLFANIGTYNDPAFEDGKLYLDFM